MRGTRKLNGVNEDCEGLRGETQPLFVREGFLLSVCLNHSQGAAGYPQCSTVPTPRSNSYQIPPFLILSFPLSHQQPLCLHFNFFLAGAINTFVYLSMLWKKPTKSSKTTNLTTFTVVVFKSAWKKTVQCIWYIISQFMVKIVKITFRITFIY